MNDKNIKNIKESENETDKRWSNNITQARLKSLLKSSNAELLAYDHPIWIMMIRFLYIFNGASRNNANIYYLTNPDFILLNP